MKWLPQPINSELALARNIIRISEKLLALSLKGKKKKKKMQIFFFLNNQNVPVMIFHSLPILML